MTKPYLKQRRIKFGISAQKRWDKLKSLFTRRRLAMDGIINFARTQNENPAPPAEGEITVILNTYARTEYLPSQIEALKRQTVPIREIWIWSNQSHKPQYDLSPYCDRWVVSNHNWKFFGRFTLALMAETPYIALFDDDILPGPRWLENCLETIKRPEYRGILGGSGVRLPTTGGYEGNTRVGWHGPHNEKPEEVDPRRPRLVHGKKHPPPHVAGNAAHTGQRRRHTPLLHRPKNTATSKPSSLPTRRTTRKNGAATRLSPAHGEATPPPTPSPQKEARHRPGPHRRPLPSNGWQIFNERNPS